MDPNSGYVYWITGYPGAGKSTLAKALYNDLLPVTPRIVLLDGDKLREVFGKQVAFSYEQRLELALSYARLCKFLSDQGLNVIIATVSMFDSCRDWNRKNIFRYREIYLKASRDLLLKRDQKGLYSGATAGVTKDVPSMDLALEEPKQPDLVLEVDGNQSVEMLLETAKRAFTRY